MTSAASNPKYICLAAGGTGGHVMPAICIAETLLADGHRILLLTDKRGAPHPCPYPAQNTCLCLALCRLGQ